MIASLPCLTLEGGSTGVEPVEVLEKPAAVANSDRLLCHIICHLTFVLLSNLKPLSQHLRYLTLAWRSAVTRCYKAERKVTGATFSSSRRAISNPQPGWQKLRDRETAGLR